MDQLRFVEVVSHVSIKEQLHDMFNGIAVRYSPDPYGLIKIFTYMYIKKKYS